MGEWYPATAPVEGGEACVGHEGLQKWWADVMAAWEKLHAPVDDIRDTDDVVVALGRLQGRSQSGVEFDSELGWVVRFRDGLAVLGRGFF